MKTGQRAPWLVDPKLAPRTLATLRRGPPKEKGVLPEKSQAPGKRPVLCEPIDIIYLWDWYYSSHIMKLSKFLWVLAIFKFRQYQGTTKLLWVMSYKLYLYEVFSYRSFFFVEGQRRFWSDTSAFWPKVWWMPGGLVEPKSGRQQSMDRKYEKIIWTVYPCFFSGYPVWIKRWKIMEKVWTIKQLQQPPTSRIPVASCAGVRAATARQPLENRATATRRWHRGEKAKMVAFDWLNRFGTCYSHVLGNVNNG